MMKILVIRFKQIGDAILSSALCDSLRLSFPDAQIDYVLYEHVAPVFLHHPAISNVIVITKRERKNLFAYIKKVRAVTRTKYDIVIDIMSTAKSELFSLFSLSSPWRIGRLKKYRGYTYTHRIPEPPDDLDKVAKFLKMLEPLEKAFPIRYEHHFRITVTPEEKAYFRERMRGAGIDFSRPVFACAVETRVPHKRYPVERMLSVVATIRERYHAQMIFFYAPEQKEFVEGAKAAMGDRRDIFTDIPTKSMRELAMLLTNCDMYMGNEGGARHLAQALGLPSFAIFFPTSDKKQWIPNADWRSQGVISSDIRANLEGLTYDEKYNLITPEYVVGKICEMFDRIQAEKQ